MYTLTMLPPILISSTLTDSGLICCYSPYFNKMFFLRTPLRAPESRMFSAAASGWVILRRSDNTVLFGSLLDGSTFETSKYKYDQNYFCTSLEDGTEHLGVCSIFGVHASMFTVRIQSWNGESWKYFGGSDDDNDDDDFDEDDDNDSDEDDEKEDEEDDVRPFIITFCCDPVLHKGLLYCLGEGGSLGVYDPKRIKWSVLRKPTSFGSEFPYKNCYLVESHGELLAVLTGMNGTPIYVLRLNETKVTWERMKSLGRRAIFMGTVASLSMANPPETMANKVYLPRFYGRSQVIEVDLTISGDRLFFVQKGKERQRFGSNESADMGMREHGTSGENNGAWCHDLELDSGVDKQIVGCKNLLQYVWVNLGRASS
uniref:KIB1-4 beta-propeller domain-containing protein n=1 Tax=Arundo donax TaxID=35708 RepID=A0A0A9CKN6_ARUDO